MSKINGYTVDWLNGTVPPMTNTIDVRERAGTDGYTFVRKGKRSPQFQVVVRDTLRSLSAARDRCTDFEALTGKFVTLEDPGGRSFSKVMVLGVTAQASPILFSTDGSAAIVNVTFTLQRGR